MGDAKKAMRRRVDGPCACGSGKPGASCCFTGGWWRKPPAILGLRGMKPGGALSKCYMASLNSCGNRISGEHLISEGVIKVLQGDGSFTVSGLPWLAPGVEKKLSPGNLTANVLCTVHNSAISPLDAAAINLFAPLKSALEKTGPNDEVVVSGHDIERWFLKTAQAMAASGNLSQNQIRLGGTFASGADIIDLIDDPTAWPLGSGLYCVMPFGETAEKRPQFQLQPLLNDKWEIIGLGLNVLGIRFVLLLDFNARALRNELRGAVYRPGGIKVINPGCVKHVTLSWLDPGAGRDTLYLNFLREIDPTEVAGG